MMRIFFLLFLCMAATLTAQVPSNPIGLNPPSLRWQQISTDKVQVVFPRGYDSLGIRVADIVHHLWDLPSPSIGPKREKVSIFLHGQTNYSNGFVTVGPFRSEFFLLPPQFDVANNWVDQLTIHEYRHVQQFVNSLSGWPVKVARSAFGSWAWGGVMAAALPRWYFEGDATAMETAWSNAGRGRLPDFTMEYRSLVLDSLQYKYEKAAAGSYRDFVPNFYHLGYWMTAYGRDRFGADVWKKTMEDAVDYKGIFFPFSHALKKHTGLKTKELYTQMQDDLRKQWSEPAKARTTDPSQSIITHNGKGVVNHYSPQKHPFLARQLLYIRNGYNQLPAVYATQTDGSHQKLFMLGSVTSSDEFRISSGYDRLCWAEFTPDPRWGNRSYSVLKTFTPSTRNQKQLTHQTRLFSPALSDDGQLIAAVEVDELSQASLVLLDANTGDVQQTLNLPNADFYRYPCFQGKEHLLVVIQQDNANYLARIHLPTQAVQQLTELTPVQVSYPASDGQRIVFSAAYTGINQVFEWTESGLNQLTFDPLGAFQPAILGDSLVYNAFRTQGFELRKTALSHAQPFRIRHYEEPLAALLSQQEGGSVLDNIQPGDYDILPYRRTQGLVYPHSVLPYAYPPLAGGSVLFDNKFGTLSGDASVYYNYNEDRTTWSGNLSFAQWFPVLEAGLSQAERSSSFLNFSFPSPDSLLLTQYAESWKETSLRYGLSIPLNVSKGKFSNRIRFSVSGVRSWVEPDNSINDPKNSRQKLRLNQEGINTFRPLVKAPLAKTDFHALDARFAFSLLRLRAYQHLYPRFGISGSARLRQTLGNETFSAKNWLAQSTLYLPGLGRNHSLRVSGSWQDQAVLDNYRFTNIYMPARGYNAPLADEYLTLGVNYAMPLFYPDWALGGLAFLKRIKANAFYDMTQAQLNFPFNQQQQFRSVGVELTADLRLLRLVEVDAGVRYSYLLDKNFAPKTGQHQFEFLLLSITQ